MVLGNDRSLLLGQRSAVCCFPGMDIGTVPKGSDMPSRSINVIEMGKWTGNERDFYSLPSWMIYCGGVIGSTVRGNFVEGLEKDALTLGKVLSRLWCNCASILRHIQ